MWKELIYISFQKDAFEFGFSGAITLLNFIHLGVEFDFQETKASGYADLEIGPAVVSANFTFNPKSHTVWITYL